MGSSKSLFYAVQVKDEWEKDTKKVFEKGEIDGLPTKPTPFFNYESWYYSLLLMGALPYLYRQMPPQHASHTKTTLPFPPLLVLVTDHLSPYNPKKRGLNSTNIPSHPFLFKFIEFWKLECDRNSHEIGLVDDGRRMRTVLSDVRVYRHQSS